MARRAVFTLACAGLFVGTLASLFLGCFTDYKSEKGSCQPTMMAIDECTIPKCNADGTPAYEPVPNAEKRLCFRGENEGVCVDGACALTCEAQMTPCKCSSDAACPTDKQCLDWACEAAECKSTLKPDDMLVDTLEVGDCMKSVCKAGMPQPVPDTADIPAEAEKDCRKPACTLEGMQSTDPNDMDMPDDATLDDCKKDSCLDGMKVIVNDDTDKPADTGCSVYTCNSGTLTQANAPPGKQVTGGFCDSLGNVVPCLREMDWKACGGKMCKAKLCPAEPCTANADCQGMFCADGFCCNTACTDECKSCGLTGKEGMCSNIPALAVDESYTDAFGTPNLRCENNFLCNGAGMCLKRGGVVCVVDSDCISNKCVMSPMSAMKLCLGATGESCANNGQCASNKCNTTTTLCD